MTAKAGRPGAVRTSSRSRGPLTVHVLLHDSSGSASDPPRSLQLARRLTEELGGEERSPDIPVRVWRAWSDNGALRMPPPVPLQASSRNLVVTLVDPTFFAARERWSRHLTTLRRMCRPGSDLVLPVALGADARAVHASFQDLHYLGWRNDGEPMTDDGLSAAIQLQLVRMLHGDTPRIFLCHSKARRGTERIGSGEEIALSIARQANEHHWTYFFDRHRIPLGAPVWETIRAEISGSVVLAIWTDSLLESSWCVSEIIEARRTQRPLVVLDALDQGAPRVFPFLGNMPVLRWRGDPAAVIRGLTLEVLRTQHQQLLFERLVKEPRTRIPFTLHPPDVLDAALQPHAGRLKNLSKPSARPAPLCVYPDPPIRPAELHILRSLHPGRMFLSLAEWRGLRAAGAIDAGWKASADACPGPLGAIRVGVSISPTESWVDLGLLPEHQDRISADIARTLIVLGAKVIWGGDLRAGFGSKLENLVRMYQHPTRSAQDHVGLVVPFQVLAISSEDAAQERERRMALAEVVEMPPPAPGWPPAQASAATTAAFAALAFSDMRQRLATGCQARIVLGGAITNYKGIYPGIFEEALLTLRAGKRLYVLGGFGGAASLVARALDGDTRDLIELLAANSVCASPQVRAAHEDWLSRVEIERHDHMRFDPSDAVHTLARVGLKGLSRSNGLSPGQNLRLLESTDLYEIVDLLVRGITSCPKGRPDPGPKGPRPELRPAAKSRVERVRGRKGAR